MASGQHAWRPGQPDARPGRRSLRWWLGGGGLLALALLVWCYLRIAGTMPVISDGAGEALAAWDMLHGNLLLHGWWAADVSFYTTELPQYMLAEALAGLRPEVVHICAALTYTLLVLLAALVARGRARGAEGLVRALLAAGILLAPQPGAPATVLLLSPDHVGTAVPVLLLLLLLDWAPRRWYVPAAAGVLLAWSAVGDPLILVVGVLPLVAVCLARGCQGLLRRVPPRRLWYEFSLAAAAALAFPAAQLANRFIRARGGFQTDQIPLSIQHSAVLRANAPYALRGFLGLFGADVASARGRLDQVFAIIHLAGAALVLAAVVLAGWRLARSLAARGAAGPADVVADVLVVAIVLNVAAYFFLFRLTNTYAAHDIGPVAALGAALAGRVLGGPLLRARLVPALAAGLAACAVMLGFAAARPQARPANASLVAFLARHDLRQGLGPYWEASSTTLDSGGEIVMGSVTAGPDGRLAPWRWLEDLRPFDPARHAATFFVTRAGESLTAARAVATFGRPALVYRYQDYTILVWRKNLLPALGPPFWKP